MPYPHHPSYTALVNTGSTATLVRSDVVPAGMQLEPTGVKLRIGTGRGMATLHVGGLSVNIMVWVAEVQDPCIFCLDFLHATQCVLDLGKNTVAFPGGPTIDLVHPLQTSVTHLPSLKATEVHQA